MTGKNGKDVAEVVAEVVEENPLGTREIKLSSGVVLLGRQAPPLALIKVLAAFPRPKPPVWKNPQMGREMENPDDPNYIEALKAHQNESSNAMLNAMILLGTELKSVPKKFSRPEDDEWLDVCETMGLTTRPQSKSWRYVTWVTLVAVLNEEDLVLIRNEVARLSGVPEDTVQSAEAFPGRGKNP